MSTPIRTGLIGFGMSGQIFHAPFLRNHADYVLSHVSSSRHATVRAQAPEARPCDHPDELMAAPDVDLIVITTPNATHYSLARQALEAGKHVLLEKPAVTRVAEMDTLIELAARHDRILSVYQNRRYDGDFLALSALVEEHRLGTLRQLDSRFDRFRPEPTQRWRDQPGEGSGIFRDLAPHLLDQILVLLGTPQSVYTSLRTLRPGARTPDWFEVHLDYPGTAVVAGASPFQAGTPRRFSAGFDGGTWQSWGVDPQEAALTAGQTPRDTGYPSRGTYPWANVVTMDTSTRHPLDSGHYGRFYDELRDAIRGTGAGPVPLEEARNLIALLNLCETSAARGRRLAWHP